MKTMNGAEAFAALGKGKKVECRMAGFNADFADISDFAATVYFDPRYEFRIPVEMLQLCGVEFPKPLDIESVEQDQEIFIVYPTCIHSAFFDAGNSIHLDCVRNGFVQAIENDAKLQMKAICAAMGSDVNYPPVIPLEQKKKRSKKTKNDSETVYNEGTVPASHEAPTDVLQVDDPLPFFNEPESSAESSNNEKAVEDSIETDPVKLVEKFTAQINGFTDTNGVLSFRNVFLANGHLDREHTQHLCKLTEDKLLELDPEQYTPKLKSPSENLSIEELQRLQAEAEKLVTENRLAEQAESEYQTLLKELLEGVANAATPAEVNSHTRYTKPWTELQRKPLLNAIHKRLQELAPAEAEIKMPPSLMVQIQNAPDLTTLDALEIDVSTRHADIQPRLMSYVKQRRFELENQASEAS